jgi:hypothetical protein
MPILAKIDFIFKINNLAEMTRGSANWNCTQVFTPSPD